MNVGVYSDLSNEQYHASEGVSRSTLWTMHTKTAAHARFATHEETEAMAFGTAVHMGVLQPSIFGHHYGRLPNGHNGTTKAGKEAKAEIEAAGLIALKSDKYDSIISMREKLWREPLISKALTGAMFEHSAYWNDATTNVLCKVRPDAYNPDLKIMIDLKTTEDASSKGFAKSIANYGYHFQQAWYRDGWAKAGGGAVEAFIFIAIEKEQPLAYSIFELDAESEEVGRAAYKQALLNYAKCREENVWPSYPSGVQQISLPIWAMPDVLR